VDWFVNYIEIILSRVSNKNFSQTTQLSIGITILILVRTFLTVLLLAILKTINYVGVFRGVSAVILALLTAILIEVIPMIILLTGYTPTDVDPARSFIINYELWPAIIVTEATYVLILGIMIMRISLDEHR
jgi:hypothetical protein